MKNPGLKGLAVMVAVTLGVAGCGKKDDAAGAGGPEEPVLNVYNWSDYISDNAIGDFETATGIQVTYDMFDSNEVLETKLLAGSTGYDIVVPSASFLERQIKAGVFMPLDKSKLPNLANMDPEIMARVALHDPDNTYAVPYLWGTTGIGYNPEKVKEVLGTDTIDSWATIFEPENAAKLAKCGLVMLDAPTEVFDTALIYLGKDPNGENEEDLNAAKDLIMKVRPHVRYFHSSSYIDDLANGEICVALGWSGDIFQARDAGAEAETPVTVAYSIPKEGAIMWFDMMAIPADAKHPDNAHQFINYLMDPQVIAGITNYVVYANGNAASLEFVDEETRNDPAVYPTAEVKQKLFASLAESEDYSRLSNRAWTNVQTGQ
ncbi:MAG: polyamine ABC transporter substrate-binding protein [Steroidobacteraceae bacterium]